MVGSDWTRRDDTSFSSETLRVTIHRKEGLKQRSCCGCAAELRSLVIYFLKKGHADLLITRPFSVLRLGLTRDLSRFNRFAAPVNSLSYNLVESECPPQAAAKHASLARGARRLDEFAQARRLEAAAAHAAAAGRRLARQARAHELLIRIDKARHLPKEEDALPLMLTARWHEDEASASSELFERLT